MSGFSSEKWLIFLSTPETASLSIYFNHFNYTHLSNHSLKNFQESHNAKLLHREIKAFAFGVNKELSCAYRISRWIILNESEFLEKCILVLIFTFFFREYQMTSYVASNLKFSSRQKKLLVDAFTYLCANTFTPHHGAFTRFSYSL